MAAGTRFFPPLGPARGSSGPVAPRGWDRCVLGGQVVPGFCRIPRGNVRLKIDKKRKKGSNGSNPTMGGMDPQPIVMEVMTYSDEDREALADLFRPYIPQPNQKPTPLSIDHPSLRLNHISAVIIIDVGALIPVEGKPMHARVAIEMLHWLPTDSSDATTTPKGAPVRKPNNQRNRKPPPTPPTQHPGVCGPPKNFTPAR